MLRNLLSAVAVVSAVSLPATAQVNLEMNKITCADWLAYSQDSKQFVQYWMSGYYSAARNDNVLDFRRMNKNSDKVAAYCKKNKSAPLPAAIRKVAL